VCKEASETRNRQEGECIDIMRWIYFEPIFLDGSTLPRHALLMGDAMNTAHEEFGWKANILADDHDHFQIPPGQNEMDNTSFGKQVPLTSIQVAM
jgi:hypothetical protein